MDWFASPKAALKLPILIQPAYPGRNWPRYWPRTTHQRKKTAASANRNVDLLPQVREAMTAGDKKKIEEASNALNDRLLNFAYLL
jgi:hypothetical protein